VQFVTTASGFSYHAGVKTRWSRLILLSSAAMVRHGGGDLGFFLGA
jgi:hypothetical protein